MTVTSNKRDSSHYFVIDRSKLPKLNLLIQRFFLASKSIPNKPNSSPT